MPRKTSRIVALILLGALAYAVWQFLSWSEPPLQASEAPPPEWSRTHTDPAPDPDVTSRDVPGRGGDGIVRSRHARLSVGELEASIAEHSIPDWKVELEAMDPADFSPEARARISELRRRGRTIRTQPQMINLKHLYQATASYRTALMYQGSPMTESVKEREVMLYALGADGEVSPSRVAEEACTSQSTPMACDDEVYPTCATYRRLMAVASSVCADPLQAMPSYDRQRRHDFARPVRAPR